jgi:hypothetical protein
MILKAQFYNQIRSYHEEERPLGFREDPPSPRAPADNRSLEIYSKDGAAKATELTVWELRSAWE